jgi:23S rRNA pseudouridine1911/1915/1917 synthase
MLNFTADTTERLDKFLAVATGKSRSRVQKAIKDGLVKVDGEIVSEPDHHVEADNKISLPEFREFELVPSDRKLKIVYEDNDLAVIDKEAGLVVHPGAGNKEDTMAQSLLAHFPQIKHVGEKLRPGIVHRLDEDTSGLMVVAKTPAAYDYLKQLFAERKVEKEYLALVHGIPQMAHDIIDVPVAKNFTQRKMKAGTGKDAVTEYTVIADNVGEIEAESGQKSGVDQMALLRVKLHTGRTHQIRVHLSHIKHPIVGDQTYGGNFKKTDPRLLGRQFLHAFHLKFQKPDGDWLDLRSALPDDLKQLLNKLGIKYDHII